MSINKLVVEKLHADHKFFGIRDAECEYWRSCRALDSPECWTKSRTGAAAFGTREAANECVSSIRRGEDCEMPKHVLAHFLEPVILKETAK